MSLIERLVAIRTGICASIQAMGGKCLCSSSTSTIANVLEDLTLMKNELNYLTTIVVEDVPPPPPPKGAGGEAPKRPRSRSPIRPHRNCGIFIRYMHSGIGDDEEVYNVGHLDKDIELEKRRLAETIFAPYGDVFAEETQVWEGEDNAYRGKVPFAKVFFADEKGKRAALNDAARIEKEYRLRIVSNKNPPRK